MFCRLPLGLVPPFGYFVCWCIESAAIFCVFSTIIPLNCIFIGGCWLFHSFIRDISRDLSHLNRKQSSKSTSTITLASTTIPTTTSSKSTSNISSSTLSPSQPLNDHELKVHFCSIVKLFSELKELSSNPGLHFMNRNMVLWIRLIFQFVELCVSSMRLLNLTFSSYSFGVCLQSQALYLCFSPNW